MKTIKIVLLGILVMGMLILSVVAPERAQNRFILPVGYCTVCLNWNK